MNFNATEAPIDNSGPGAVDTDEVQLSKTERVYRSPGGYLIYENTARAKKPTREQLLVYGRTNLLGTFTITEEDVVRAENEKGSSYSLLSGTVRNELNNSFNGLESNKKRKKKEPV